MIFNSFQKKIGRKFLPKKINHASLSFIYNKTSTIDSKLDPLLSDEVEYQKQVRNIDNFQFNEGHYRFNQNYFLATVKNVYVEPTYGIAIKGFSAIIEETAFFEWYNVSKKSYLKARLFSPGKIAHIKEAVMFDCSVGLNYFHFYNDIISKIEVLKENYFDEDIPLIIGERVWSSRPFQFFLQFPVVKDHQWFILRSDRFLFVNKLHYIKAQQYNYVAIGNMAELAKKSDYIKSKEVVTYQKIFINRKSSSGRFINNFKDVALVLIGHGFKIVYLEEFTIGEQVSLIKNAKTIIGIHGAGLTNLIYANRADCYFLEIMPINYMPTHYYWLASVFNINYKIFFGNELDTQSSFTIDVERFDKHLKMKIIGGAG